MKKILLVLVLSVVLGLFYVRGQVELVHLSYQIKDKEQTIEEIVVINQSLEYELAALEAPTVLEKYFADAGSEEICPAAWQVAGTVMAPQTGVFISAAVIAAAQPKRNLWNSIFNNAIAEASANNVVRSE